MKRSYWESVFLMVGMIVGAGIFAVPYVFSRSGIIFGSITTLVVLGVVMATHLMFAELSIATGGKHRLIGMATEVFGKKAGKWTTLIVVLGNFGSLLAYMVLGGIFLHALISHLLGGSLFVYQMAFLILGGLSLSFGAKLIGELNSILTIALIALLVLIIIIASRGMFVPNVMAYDITRMFGAYGVVLFSLLGINAVPEMNELLGKKSSQDLRPTVKIGTLIAAAITLLFGISVVGFNGPYTTRDAITGLATQLGPWVLIVGAVVGLLAVFTSFIITALSLDETYQVDFHLKPKQALAWSLVPIVFLYLIGVQDLVKIMSFTGTILGGASCITIALIYKKLLKDKKMSKQLRYGSMIPNACVALLVLGMFAQLSSR